MKKFSKALLISISILTLAHSQACEANNCYSTFSEYTGSMGAKGLPLTLIIGCGHGTWYTDGDHSHPDSWCINLKADPSLRGFPHNKPKTFKESVNYDEILDISKPHMPIKNKNTSENLSVRDYASSQDTQNIVGYKNTFDVVLLERPLPITLNKPWALWNAVHMLKVGGELIIDSIDGYNSNLYVNESSFKTLCPPQDQDYPVNQSTEKLEKFGINVIKINYDMEGIRNYLSFWGLTDIINVGDSTLWRTGGYQPYTKAPGKSLETARKTRILSATKSLETENKMEAWAQAIQNFQGLRAISIDVITTPVVHYSSPIQLETDSVPSSQEMILKSLEINTKNTEAEEVIFTAPTIAEVREDVINEVALELFPKEILPKLSIPDELRIIVPVIKREPVPSVTPTIVVQPTTTTITPNTQKIYSLGYCADLYRKINKNSEAIETILYNDSHRLQDRRSIDLLLEIRRELREAQDIIDTIEDPHTTTQDRALIAIFAPDRLEFMQRYMSAVERHPELSGWLQKIGFKW